MIEDPGFEHKIFKVGSEIFEKSQNLKLGLFEKGFWSSKMMEWSMQFPLFKIEMFRFVDVLPSLNRPEQVAEHVRQYFLRESLDFPTVIRAGMSVATSNSLTSRMAASAIKKNVASMASNFITGQDAQSASATLERLWKNGFCFTVDILGESAVCESEALDYQQKYLNLVKGLAEESTKWPANKILEEAPYGKVPRANVSVKCSSLYSQIDNLAFRHSVDEIKKRLRPILSAAVEREVFVNLDMEQNDFREIVMTVAEELFAEEAYRSYPHFGIVVQAYLKKAQDDIRRINEWAVARGAPITIRLVKGAYWDYEVIQAEQRGFEPPVFLHKSETDTHYEECAELLLDFYPNIYSAFGSHNVRNLAFVVASAETKLLPPGAFEMQMLYGMAEPFKRALSAMGFRLREYAPVGEMLPGMAYLVRRLLENTSNEGFLRAKFVNHTEAKELLQNPRIRAQQQSAEAQEKIKQGKINRKGDLTMFKNESYQDFSLKEVRETMDQSLQTVKKNLPIECPTIVAGKMVESREKKDFPNPSHRQTVASRYSLSSQADAEQALNACQKAIKTWGERPVSERVAIVRKAGELLRKNKNQLSALMVLEVGKNYREADADTAEAIDFCFYYADEMEKLAKARPTSDTPGESNFYLYRPRGTTVAISPWNFPLAILCGMTVAPLVCGNPVIMKPAEQSSGIAKKLFDLLIEAGVPSEALHLIPGKGEEVGRFLVSHPQTHIINFTGSRAVGLQILEEAAKVKPGQRHIKKVIIELGGKNGLIIDEDADLDEAVQGALHSGFGFQGQKCSALSRVLVHESCYDKFKNRFKEAILSIKVGPAEDPSNRVGPVIDEETQARLLKTIEKYRSNIVAQVELSPEMLKEGNYVPPTLFESSDLNSELGQSEFFGPLVTLFKMKNFDESLAAINGVDYALTGGIYSRSPQNLERAKNEIEVGNLYINRAITGALVGKQPFGGFKLSGAGGKAGGPDYLLNFLEPRTQTENTMRRGFAPETTK